jgi:hypothetical protein
MTAGRPDRPSFQFQLPVTALALTNVVNGQNGWLVADPTVTLTAKDYSGTGIARVEYGHDQVSWSLRTCPDTRSGHPAGARRRPGSHCRA